MIEPRPPRDRSVVAHTDDDARRRYFEPHHTWRKPWASRGGEVRTWDELIEPEFWHPGHEVRP